MLICKPYVLTLVIGLPLPATAQSGNAIPGVRAHLNLDSHNVPIGQPVWVRFSLENLTDEPITLTVPGMEPEIPSPEVGLPLPHIFSGTDASGVSVTTEANRRWESPVAYRAPARAPILMIAPHSTVGSSIDLREYFPALRSGGRYRVSWSPYNGDVASKTITVTIAPRKQVEIVTDEGTMTLRLFYNEAPQHVENFIELVKTGSYAGKTFHRLEPGYLLQGGCPRGDGTGIRSDGKRVPAEFNEHVHQKGSVSMALLGDDPDSASCQFFICNTRQKEWDGRYTVFAQLVGEESLTTLDRLMLTPVDERGRPQKTLYLRSVRLTDAPPDAYSDMP